MGLGEWLRNEGRDCLRDDESCADFLSGLAAKEHSLFNQRLQIHCSFVTEFPILFADVIVKPVNVESAR